MLVEYFILGMITYFMTGAQCEDTEVFAEAGSQAVLPCKSSILLNYSPAIIWSKDNKGTVWRKQKSGLQYWGASWSAKGTQRVRCPHSKFETGDCSLQIDNVRKEDGGVYTCRVENGPKVEETSVILRIIEVTVSSPVSIWGKDVSISCNVTPWPYGASQQWRLNNSPYEPQNQITSNGRTTARVISGKATARLAGNWTCVVGSNGKEGRASAALSVQGIIDPPNDQTKVYAAVGSAVTLPCVFSSSLSPSNPVWEKLKPGFLIKPTLDRLPASFSPPSPVSQLHYDQSASLTQVGFEDSGRYRCSANIEGQKLTRYVQLVVGKIDSLIPSENLSSMELTCQLTDTSEVSRYEWVHVVYDLNGTRSEEIVHTDKTLTLSKTSEENRGEWACRFYGKDGLLGNITHHIQMMSGVSGQKPSDASHNTAATVGLSFLLLILLLVLAQLYKNHQRRKKIFQYPALETIVHTVSNEREQRERSKAQK